MEKEIEKYLQSTQYIILSFLIYLGPFVVALMPAAFVSISVYALFDNWLLGIVVAFIVAVAIETVGILITHTSVKIYNAYRAGMVELGKLIALVSFVPIYIITTMATVYFSESFGPIAHNLGMASPIFTTMVYFAIALLIDLKRVEGEAEEIKATRRATNQDNRAWKIEEKRAELAHKFEMEKRGQTTGQIQTETGQKTGHMGDMSAANRTKQEKMSARQDSVLSLVQAGKSQVEIAQILDASPKTISRDIKALNGKIKQ